MKTILLLSVVIMPFLFMYLVTKVALFAKDSLEFQNGIYKKMNRKSNFPTLAIKWLIPFSIVMSTVASSFGVKMLETQTMLLLDWALVLLFTSINVLIVIIVKKNN